MYTSLESIQIVIALLKKFGIRHIVTSPGMRSVPVVHSVENDPFFITHNVVDERSAVYYAIGIALETGEPCVVTCTSAQATRNYLPGLTEAYYKKIPIVALTGDCLREVAGQLHEQSLWQENQYPRDAVRYSCTLPQIKDKEDYMYVTRLVNEALLELDHHGRGPVHINFQTNYATAFPLKELPDIRKISRYDVNTIEKDRLNTFAKTLTGKRIAMLFGADMPKDEKTTMAIKSFANKYGAAIWGEHFSNLNIDEAIFPWFAMTAMTNEELAAYMPDVLITFGEIVGINRMSFISNKIKVAFRHIRVNLDGAVRDTYNSLTDIFENTTAEFCLAFALVKENIEQDKSYIEMCRNVSQVDYPEYSFSYAWIAQQFSVALPQEANLHLAINNSIRWMNHFKIPANVVAHGNTAAYGIDGCVSTFLGQAVVSNKMSFLMVGDLTFLYDMNSISIKELQKKSNIRILIVNNNGGGEFRQNLRHSNFVEDLEKNIAAGGHNFIAKGWVESCNYEYLSAYTKEEFTQLLPHFIEDDGRSKIFEVFTNSDEDKKSLELILASNQSTVSKIQNSFKNFVKGSLSDSVKQKIKSVIR